MLKSICQIIQQRITRQTMQTGTESTAIFTTDKWIAWEKMSSCSLSLSFSIYLPHSLPSAPNLSPSHIFTKLHGHTENHIVASSSRNPSLELKHFSKSFPASFSFHLMHFCRAKRLTEVKTIGSKFASRPTLSISKRTIGIYMCLVTQSCPVLCDPMDYSPPSSSGHRDSPSKNTGVGWHALLQGIFPTQALNLGLPHCRQILYHLSHQRSTRILEWVAYPFCRGPSQPRNWTRVSCIAGGFFASWATREAQFMYVP